MIRINLLPVRESRRAASLRKQGALLSGALGFGVLVCIVMQLWVSTSVSLERGRVAEAQAERAQLAETLKKIEAYQAEGKAISRKLEIIEDLERSRVGPVRVLSEVAARIPERLWLTRMKLSGGLLRIEGMSLDNEIIAAFMTKLENSDFVSGVELKSTRLKLTDGVKLNVFSLEARSHTQPSGEAPLETGAGSAS